jgi:leader peptidase (prepilin peptidase)/N-methyltransferase
MSIPVTAGAAILGGVASGFVPLLAHRLSVPSGDPPRSACARCARPFPGWVRFGAPCPCARWPWPAVLGGAVAAALLTGVADWPVSVAAAVGVLLVQIDVRCRRLPDRVVGVLAVVVALPPAVRAPLAESGAAVAAAGVVGSAYLVVAIASGGGLGLGDVKLAAVLALGLGYHGWPAVILGAVLPHLLMGPVALVLLLGRRVRRGTALPFGPALLAGALVAAVAAGPAT